jgi:hypothetical protein
MFGITIRRRTRQSAKEIGLAIRQAFPTPESGSWKSYERQIDVELHRKSAMFVVSGVVPFVVEITKRHDEVYVVITPHRTLFFGAFCAILGAPMAVFLFTVYRDRSTEAGIHLIQLHLAFPMIIAAFGMCVFTITSLRSLADKIRKLLDE